MSMTSSTVGGKIKYKVVLLGDQHVGKTSIIERFINDRFENTYNATIGIDFLVRNLSHKNKTYRLQLWDTAGQQRFKSLIPSYLRDSNLSILVYDTNDEKSLENIEKWKELYDQYKEPSAFCVIVGNKCDIAERVCTDEIIEEKLKCLKDVHHFRISAKTGEGVSQMFLAVIDLIHDKLNSIKLIEQIDEKVEKQIEHQDKNQGESVEKKENGAIKLDNSNQIKPVGKRTCC